MDEVRFRSCLGLEVDSSSFDSTDICSGTDEVDLGVNDVDLVLEIEDLKPDSWLSAGVILGDNNDETESDSFEVVDMSLFSLGLVNKISSVR